jgi:hypothetical protein
MKKIIIVLVFGGIFFMSTPSFSYAAFPMGFGGQVVSIQPCNTGLLVYIRTAYAVQPFMWFTGELPYSWYIPPHPGQWMLGMYSTVVVPCILGIIPMGAGFPILYHGSSL